MLYPLEDVNVFLPIISLSIAMNVALVVGRNFYCCRSLLGLQKYSWSNLELIYIAMRETFDNYPQGKVESLVSTIIFKCVYEFIVKDYTITITTYTI